MQKQWNNGKFEFYASFLDCIFLFNLSTRLKAISQKVEVSRDFSAFEKNAFIEDDGIKKNLVIAGPNEAGKTTTALELISNSPILYEFINADEIAKGLAPKHPESVALAASKLMISRVKELLEDSKNFAFETTFSGKNYEKHLKLAKSKGYEIILFFLWLASPEQAVKRVAQRVSQGGHHVAEEVIVRRYYAGLKNLLNCYLPFSDMAVIVNNSTEESKSKLGNLIDRKSTPLQQKLRGKISLSREKGL